MRVRVWLAVTILFLLAAVVGSGMSVAAANFGYKDIYELGEDGNWKSVSDESVSIGPEGPSKPSFGSTGGPFGIAVESGLDKYSAQTGGLSAFGTAGYTVESNTAVFTSSSEMFSITVKALPFDNPELVDMTWIHEPWVDDEGQYWPGYFYLMYSKIRAQWQFTYRVTNTLDRTITINEVKDNFGAELDVVGYPTTGSGTVFSEATASEDWTVRRSSPSTMTMQAAPFGSEVPVDTGVLTITEREQNFGFHWENFALEPGEWAEVTFHLETGRNPAGIQSYSSCGIYALNSQGALKYRHDGQSGEGQTSVAGKAFSVSVCTPPSTSISIEINKGVRWYLKKPGSYFAQVIEGVVSTAGSSRADVAVTFSDFDDLKKGTEMLPVQYYIGEAIPDTSDWFSPQFLNETMIRLGPTNSSPAHLWVWQNVVLQSQSPGQYINTGVITFTLINNQPYVEGL